MHGGDYFKNFPVVILFILFMPPYMTSASDVSSIEVFCGSAIKPAIEEAVQRFTETAGVAVNLHTGSSGVMLSQLKISRRGDVYIPGSPDFLIKAERDGVVTKGGYSIISYLLPSIVVPYQNDKNISSFSNLEKPGTRVLIANPESVCLGVYAIELLKGNGVYEKVKPNIVTYAESCERVASIVAMGKVDAAIGWSVFEKWNPGKIKAFPLKNEEIKRIAFIPAAVTTFSSKREAAQKFIDFLISNETADILRKWGYAPTIEEARSSAPFAQVGGEYDAGVY